MNGAILPPTHVLYGVHRNDLTYENVTEISVVQNWAGRSFDVFICL